MKHIPDVGSGGQDAVRTFSEEDIKIPIFDIPLQQRVTGH